MCGNILGGGGGGDSTQHLAGRTGPPAWVQEEGRELYNLADPIASRPYQYYGDERIADFSPDELASFDLARFNIGAWEPYFNQGWAQTAASAAPVGEADISAYYNPYQKFVTDELWNENRRRQIEANAAMSRRGTYLNEDRREALNALRDEMTMREIGLSNANAFNAALAQANTQRARNLAAGGQFFGAGPQRAIIGQGDVASLQDIGAQQRAQEQDRLTLDYTDFLRQFDYPADQVEWLMAMLSGTPQNVVTNQEAFKPEYATGGGLDAGGALGTLGMMAMMAAMFGSSRDFKHDLGAPETILEAVEQMPIRKWTYTDEFRQQFGDPYNHIGPYAEDFHRLFKVGDGRHLHVLDLSGVALQAIKDLAKRYHALAERLDRLERAG